MKTALLLLALAAPASAEPFCYSDFAEMRAMRAAEDLASAKRMKDILLQFFGPEEQPGFPVKDGFTLVAPVDETTKELARRSPAFAPLARDGRQAIGASEALARFDDAQELFGVLLSRIAKSSPSDPELKKLADWGIETWVQTDPAIELHSVPVLSRADYDALKLRP